VLEWPQRKEVEHWGRTSPVVGWIHHDVILTTFRGLRLGGGRFYVNVVMPTAARRAVWVPTERLLLLTRLNKTQDILDSDIQIRES